MCRADIRESGPDPGGNCKCRQLRDARPASAVSNWRTPVVIIICGCIIALLEFRAALEPRLLRAADGPRIRLGPRRVWPRAGAAEPAVGTGPADRRRHRRPFWHRPRHGGRRAALCRRPAPDALFDDAAGARHRRGRADRFRLVGLLVQPRAVGLQQAVAAREARHRARRRHRRRIVRPVPVRAVRRRHDRQFRLAGRAHRIWRC